LLLLDDYRTVAHLRIDVDGTPVNVYATHLNERNDESGEAHPPHQVEDLLRFITETSAGCAPVVIAGDFNALVDAGDLRSCAAITATATAACTSTPTWKPASAP
jgi:endonuclease/exonuclease/phosphatase family metal-dependent hydrolase